MGLFEFCFHYPHENPELETLITQLTTFPAIQKTLPVIGPVQTRKRSIRVLMLQAKGERVFITFVMMPFALATSTGSSM